MERTRIGQKPAYPPLRREDRHEAQASFSPGGRLLQVEYARECPMGAPLAIALRLRRGVFLAKGRSVGPELGHRIPLIWPVNPDTAYVANGNLGDLFYIRDILDRRRPRSMEAVARLIRGALHDHAVRTDVRPLAVMILLGSVERAEPAILGFDVTGSQWECDAWAIGDGDLRARDILMKSWKPGLGFAAAEPIARRIYMRRRFETTFLDANRAERARVHR